MAVSHATAMVPNGTHSEESGAAPQPEPQHPPTLPGQVEPHLNGSGPQIPAHQHQALASPFQAVSMTRKASWDEPRISRAVQLDSAGNEQAPGANRQFSLELTTYASIPVRSSKSGFRPPHRSVCWFVLLMFARLLLRSSRRVCEHLHLTDKCV